MVCNRRLRAYPLGPVPTNEIRMGVCSCFRSFWAHRPNRDECNHSHVAHAQKCMHPGHHFRAKDGFNELPRRKILTRSTLFCAFFARVHHLFDFLGRHPAIEHRSFEIIVRTHPDAQMPKRRDYRNNRNAENHQDRKVSRVEQRLQNTRHGVAITLLCQNRRHLNPCVHRCLNPYLGP